MNPMQYGLLSIVVSIFITSCSSTAESSLDYYLTHPQAIQATFERCKELSVTAREQDQDCVQAIKAGEELSALLNDAITERSQFGEKIVNTQVQMINTTDPSELRELKLKLATYYAVIRLRSGNLE